MQTLVNTKSLFPFNNLDLSVKKSISESDRANFLVTSWGHCGSIWFAGSLNHNERIFSSVGVGHPMPSAMIFELNKDWRNWLNLPEHELYKYGVTKEEREILAIKRRGKHFLHDGAQETQISSMGEDRSFVVRDTSLLPTFVFDELEAIFKYSGENYKVIGNVHGTTLDQLERLSKLNDDIFSGKRVVVMDLIRHPLPRTESAIKATMKLYLKLLDPGITNFISLNSSECLELERKYKIDFDEPRARASLHVFRQGIQNDVWAYELVHFPNIQRILFERLQNEPEYFSAMFHVLSNGREIADRAFLDRVFSEENLGLGRQTQGGIDARPHSPFEQYEAWSDWEREEFSRIADRLNMPKIYLEYGYDFSFLSRKPFHGGSWFPDMLRPALIS
jgi:hypothetical protein